MGNGEYDPPLTPTLSHKGRGNSFYFPSLEEREGVKKLILTEGERGYWRSFRAVPFRAELLTMKNLYNTRSHAESYYLCLSKTAILKLRKCSRSTDSPNFFTASGDEGEGELCQFI
jgi:hypothetical protein